MRLIRPLHSLHQRCFLFAKSLYFLSLSIPIPFGTGWKRKKMSLFFDRWWHLGENKEGQRRRDGASLFLLCIQLKEGSALSPDALKARPFVSFKFEAMFCDSGFFRSEKQRKKNVRVARKSGCVFFFLFPPPGCCSPHGGKRQAGLEKEEAKK